MEGKQMSTQDVKTMYFEGKRDEYPECENYIFWPGIVMH